MVHGSIHGLLVELAHDPRFLRRHCVIELMHDTLRHLHDDGLSGYLRHTLGTRRARPDLHLEWHVLQSGHLRSFGVTLSQSAVRPRGTVHGQSLRLCEPNSRCGVWLRERVEFDFTDTDNYGDADIGIPTSVLEQIAPDTGYGCANASSSTQVSCVEKPFEFPSSASIVVTMPAQ